MPCTPFKLKSLNHPIVVLTSFTHCHYEPFAPYAMVRCINTWSDENPKRIEYSITIEIQVEAGFTLDLSKTRPCPFAPAGTIFIRPHSFQNVTYRPVPVAGIPLDEIIRVRYRIEDLCRLIDKETGSLITTTRQAHPPQSALLPRETATA